MTSQSLWHKLTPIVDRPKAIFLGLALAVLFPLLAPGYVLTLDMVFAPGSQMVDITRSSYLFYLLLDGLEFILQLYFIQKLILVAILFMSGYGMYLLARAVNAGADSDQTWTTGAYFAGLLYMINPFVYSRFMAGQFAVLLGYAALPFIIRAFLKLCRQPELKLALRFSLWTVVLGILSVHSLGLVAIICLAVLGSFVATYWRSKTKLFRLLRLLGVSGVTFLVLSCYWLVPAMLGQGELAEAVSGFSVQDQQAFATEPGKLGVTGNLLAMQGFWAEGKNLFLVNGESFAWWLLPVVSIWLVVICGIIAGIKRTPGLTWALLGVLFTGLILASGVVGSPLGNINQWLFNNLPFFAGYREPQKFSALILFSYAIFGAWGVTAIHKGMLRANLKSSLANILAPIFALPFLVSPLMFWGFQGQLRASNYPSDWYQVREVLDKRCQSDCKVLSLPWHYYMKYDFTGRVIANPAPKFFGDKIISSTDPEIAGAAAYGGPEEEQVVRSKVLPALSANAPSSIDYLRDLNIRYILLTKEHNYHDYDYLNTTNGIKILMKTDKLYLYEVK